MLRLHVFSLLLAVLVRAASGFDVQGVELLIQSLTSTTVTSRLPATLALFALSGEEGRDRIIIT